MGYSSWGCKESDTIGRLTLTNAHLCITETLATSWKVRQTQGWTSAQSRELIQDPGRPGGQAGVQPQGPCSQHRGERLLAHFGFSCRQQPQLS